MSDSNQLRNDLLAFLKARPDEFVPTTLLVKEIGKPRNEINRVLYSLYSSKYLEKKAEENGTNPQWSYSTLRDRVLGTLDSSEGKSPQDVARDLGMTKKEVNPYLYALKNDNLVKLTNEDLGRNPRWTRL